MTVHTILLIQKTSNRSTRTWFDYATVASATEAIIAMHEARLAEQYPNLPHINYSVDQLLSFIDEHQEFSALVYDTNLKAYMPRDRNWINRLFFIEQM
ncbi:9774_t:CDS:2 [Ambispora leptoticha]|uniref:9774_t:CDS:1 n=1 Tax=Ambispora leptoticha TaxID=144679 RepID=A0A9N9BWU2_9GLOM|nr:9774_t:CDS:2 [Ambispora leptoticha]